MEESEIDTFSSTTEDQTFGETFEQVFPFYLSIGMTYDQFWNQDVKLVKYYRKAHELRNEQKNQELWLQGAYIYNAIETVVYNGWCRGKGEKQRQYLDKPIPLTDDKIEEKKELDKKKQEELEVARAEVWMNNFVRLYSKQSQEP